MSNLARSIDSIVDEIRVEVTACKGAFTKAVQHALNAGRLLIQLKERLPHGEFLPAVKRCGLMPRTAQEYMRVAHHAGKIEAKGVTLTHLTLRQALDALAVAKGVDPDPATANAHGQTAPGKKRSRLASFKRVDRLARQNPEALPAVVMHAMVTHALPTFRNADQMARKIAERTKPFGNHTHPLDPSDADVGELFRLGRCLTYSFELMRDTAARRKPKTYKRRKIVKAAA